MSEPENTVTPQSLRESGQVLLVVVLLVVVVLTVGLSLAARSITNIRQSDEEDSSQRAFSAAEAGIEIALSDDSSEIEGGFEEGTTFRVTKQEVSSPLLEVNNGTDIVQNEAVDVWLAPYPAYTPRFSGNLTINWGDPSETDRCNHAALVFTLISNTTTDTRLTHLAYDPCSRGNGFLGGAAIREGSFTVGDKAYRFEQQLPLVTSGILLRIMPVYADTTVAVRTGGPNLPVQGTIIESVGTAGETQRKIVVVKENPKIPVEMFPFVLFTPENL